MINSLKNCRQQRDLLLTFHSTSSSLCKRYRFAGGCFTFGTRPLPFCQNLRDNENTAKKFVRMRTLLLSKTILRLAFVIFLVSVLYYSKAREVATETWNNVSDEIQFNLLHGEIEGQFLAERSFSRIIG